MLRLGCVRRDYAWGSPTALPELVGIEPDGRPFAELWYGAHPSSPSPVLPSPRAHARAGGTGDDDALPATLQNAIEQDPAGTLGEDVLARFGARLPYLLKLLAPARPLSLQVHPSLERAQAGFALENAAGIPRDAPNRNYRDASHKPELIYAVTTFEALSGFRAPRRAAELLEGLEAPLARRVLAILRGDPTPTGVRTAFALLLDPRSKPSAEEIAEVVHACAQRNATGSPSPRADAIVTHLAQHFAGDPGIVVSLLLNPVTLQPGQAMFIPAGGVHAYLSGIGVELMANSDNVLRAGLTTKHADVPELLDIVQYVAAPPIRIAPETFHNATRIYYAPVDDFELSVTDLDDDAPHPLPGRGPRVLVVIAGEVTVTAHGRDEVLQPGDGLFVAAAEGRVTAQGRGTVVLADVP